MAMKKVWILCLTLLLAACALPEAQGPTSTPTEPPTLTPFPTATVVWFPPSQTPAVTPTQAATPTPGVMAELGEVILREDFTSSEGWTLPSSDRGLISISGGEISIVINEPGSYFLATLEKPDLGDFYAEITASPILCSSRDEYGFLFRVYGQDQYYRFALNCGGDVRLDRIYAGGSTVLYPWTRSASVPVGAPSSSKLAVLAVGDHIYLYINGAPQATIADQPAGVGSFGVYSRSVGEGAVTIGFSDLVIREVLPK